MALMFPATGSVALRRRLSRTMTSPLAVLVAFDDSSLIAKLLKSFLQLFRIGLAGIISDHYALILHIRLDILDSLLRTQVAFDLVFTVRTMHLRRSREHNSLDITFSKRNHGTEQHGHQQQTLFHILFALVHKNSLS